MTGLASLMLTQGELKLAEYSAGVPLSTNSLDRPPGLYVSET